MDGREPTFVLLPEYAVPRVEGIPLIDRNVTCNEWPRNSVVIAGIDGLTQHEYGEVCDSLSAEVAATNMPNRVPEDNWVNCFVAWVKGDDGSVTRWIQPKIRPSWPEIDVECHDLFSGSSIYVFEAKYTHQGFPFSFSVMNCFDWVAESLGKAVREDLLEGLNAEMQREGQQLNLDWMFVIQHNPGVNRPEFLSATNDYLIDGASFPYVQRDMSVVLHVNTAVSSKPARNGDGGFSACVFSPTTRERLGFDAHPPTVCLEPKSLRGSEILRRCNDVVFREMGECIHTFSVRVPRFARPDATEKTLPVLGAQVHPTRDTTDRRLRGRAVHAAVKWMNDLMDTLPMLSDDLLRGSVLEDRAKAVAGSMSAHLRQLEGRETVDRIDWATCAFSEASEWRQSTRRRHADLWEDEEEEALEHLLHSMTCLGIAYTLNASSPSSHGSLKTEVSHVRIVAIRGRTNADCCEHYRRHVADLQRTDPVVVIIRDRHNLPLLKREVSSIMEPDGDEGTTFVSFCALADRCRTATDAVTLKGELDALLPRSRRIV